MAPPSLEGGRETQNGDRELDLEKKSLIQVTLDEKFNGDVSEKAIEGDDDEKRRQNIPTRKLEEYDINFADTREFVVQRWGDIVKATAAKLSISDQEIASKYLNWQDLTVEIQAKISDSSSIQAVKRQMARVQPLPHVLATLMRIFSGLVHPLEVNYEIIWGLVYINLKLSYLSHEKLKHTTDLLNKLRRVVELFNRCLDLCDEPNESRIAVVDFLDPMTMIFTDSIAYLHKYSSDRDAKENWPDLNESINSHLLILDQTVKHISDVTTTSKVNIDRKIKNLSNRHAPVPEPDEPGAFPIRKLPFQQNSKFFGREDELDKIFKYLSPKDDESLRTYTIYGRRGIGKTEIALQFAYTNTSSFDAVFWVQCETSVAIRLSFTSIAVALNLPGADRDGHHEENLIAVHQWLKKTQKRWLLIFDNAERDQILNGYWPVGSSGAILTTSRKYYNFAKDLSRKGETIKPFGPKESWELLLQLLGKDWKKLDSEGKIEASEITAAKNLLERLEGLPLAIQQAAILIKDPDIGGPTIAKTLEIFKEKYRTLPERHYLARSTAEKSLDTLWDMIFNSLSRNARALLGVLAWLSPDTIPVDLFLPRDQGALDGTLDFCKQDAIHIDSQNRASLVSIITASPAFETAMNQLVKRKLVKEDVNIYSIHRVVQEAVSYHDVDDLQNSFNIASRLAYEAFPKRDLNEQLFRKWSQCQVYIHHGVWLSKKFSDYAASGKLKGSDYFVKLLSSCAWYLLEINDYDVCGRVIDTAKSACEEKLSIEYGKLCNTAGGRCIELNLLVDSRAAFEETLRIWQQILPSNHPGMASAYSNLGNVELASGNVEDASDYFDRSVKLWMEGGDATASNLALTYLCVARLQKLRGQLDAAMRTTMLSESLFARTTGTDKGFMANVHYEYGNIHLRQHHWALAERSYNECLNICLKEMPVGALTAACHYSLASVEFALNHPEVAKNSLDKAKIIAELRSPNRDDGPIARILWKTAVVLESNPLGQHAKEAQELRNRAALAQQQLIAAGEGGELPHSDEDNPERNEEKDGYDVLVPLFHR